MKLSYDSKKAIVEELRYVANTIPKESDTIKKVFVYSAGKYSKEVCMGPHVKNTSKLGHFKIVKEKAISAGVRRIRAVLE